MCRDGKAQLLFIGEIIGDDVCVFVYIVQYSVVL